MSEILPESWTHEISSSLWRDENTAQNAREIVELKSKIRAELEWLWFPNLEFLFALENTQILSDVFDDLLREEEDTLELLYKKERANISFEDIPSFVSLECLHNFSDHILNVRRTQERWETIPAISKKFERFKDTLYQSKEFYDIICMLLWRSNLSQDQARVLELQKWKCEKYGVHLESQVKEKLRPIKERLSYLAEEFMKNISTFRNTTQFVLEEHQLWNMPKNFRNMAQKNAQEQWREGYVFIFTPANQDALLKYVSDPDMRKQVYVTSLNIAAEENDAIVLEMLKLRKQYAKELWFDSYADYALQWNMASSKEDITQIYRTKTFWYRDMLETDIQKICQHFGLDSVNAWDFKYYKTLYITETQEISASEVQSYLEYESVLEGVFWLVEQVFWVKFERTNNETYDEDVHVYMVSKDGKKLWYYMPDLFTHPWKRQWGWAEVLRKSVTGWKIMTNVWNIAHNSGKKYFSMLDIRTIFHELWHMIHELLSPDSDSRISWFEVEMDAIEIPSMFFENLSTSYELAHYYLKHETTGEVIPKEIFEAYLQEINFCSEHDTLRRIYFALFDLRVHGEDIPHSLDELQAILHEEFTQAMGVTWVDKNENHSFSSLHHLFYGATSIYAAWFYSYTWSDEMQKALWERVEETGWPLESPIMQAYIDYILTQWARKPSKELYDRVMI